MSVSDHEWRILGMYGLLTAVVTALYLHAILSIARSRRRKHAR